jgi:hypothetical protein
LLSLGCWLFFAPSLLCVFALKAVGCSLEY